jgi:hypothetical protein
MMTEFLIFILSHGRANNVTTLKSLRKHGYTGKIVFIIDNEDKTADKYYKNFDDVIMFNKAEIAKTFDEYDNFGDRRAIIYARNACFKISKELGYKYFIQMDDDYLQFDYRLYTSETQKPKYIYKLDKVFSALLEFYKSTPFTTIAMAQGGDFIGGKNNIMAKKPTIYRKCMNSFICSTDRPFQFVGRINEDVNTYTKKQSIGLLMGTIPMISLTQKTTQKNKGGMSDLYLDSGTYVKSFYSVIGMPSSVTIKPMGDKHFRLHHSIDWDCTVPKILSEDLKRNGEHYD